MEQLYKIILNHTQSDSFKREDLETDLDHRFSLEIAKKNLKIIQDDNKYYRQQEELARGWKIYDEELPMPENYSERSIELFLTEDKIFSIGKFWQGWGEHLNGGRIEIDSELSGMSF